MRQQLKPKHRGAKSTVVKTEPLKSYRLSHISDVVDFSRTLRTFILENMIF